MADRLRIAVAQMSSTADIDENLNQITRWTRAAAEAGCQLISFPENAPLLCPEDQKLEESEPIEGHQVNLVREIARTFKIAVHLGSFAELCEEDLNKTHNTSVVVDERGRIAAVYRKIHLFDVNVASDTAFRESDSVMPGPPEPVIVEIAGWKLGLSICYDLRFPELYRSLSASGAEVLMIPAAFTFRTGAAHWHTLMQARAIENQCYVVAAAQVGRHYGRRESYGHALVAGPWGEVVAQQPNGTGWFFTDLDRSHLQEVRAKIPCLEHRRLG